MSPKKESDFSSFMIDTHTKAKGQKKETQSDENNGGEDFLPNKEGPRKKIMEAPVRRNNDDAIKKFMHILIMIPVFSIGIGSFAFFVLKILPPILNFIRKVFIILLMGR